MAVMARDPSSRDIERAIPIRPALDADGTGRGRGLANLVEVGVDVRRPMTELAAQLDLAGAGTKVRPGSPGIASAIVPMLARTPFICGLFIVSK